MSHVGSDYDIFVADVATGAMTRLTDADGSDGWPSWAPDGATIAFATERERQHAGVRRPGLLAWRRARRAP